MNIFVIRGGKVRGRRALDMICRFSVFGIWKLRTLFVRWEVRLFLSLR